jgi:16S rRNA (guanine527-N7)-methyltransferase
VLDAGLSALGLSLDRAARAVIEAHARLLLAWTASINLTAIRDPADLARLHVVDSLTAVPVLQGLHPDGLLDLGSGGGYPGLPLAAALRLERALLVDAVHKKVRFLETVIAATGLGHRLHAEAARAEELARDARDRESWPVVTARAVSNLADLVEVALPLVAPGGVLVAWKRAPLDEEVSLAAGALAALGAGEPRIVDPQVPGLETHRLIVIPRRGRIDARFPRDPAERRRHPL